MQMCDAITQLSLLPFDFMSREYIEWTWVSEDALSSAAFLELSSYVCMNNFKVSHGMLQLFPASQAPILPSWRMLSFKIISLHLTRGDKENIIFGAQFSV